MTTPTEQLKGEHRLIKVMLQVMESICTKLEGGEKVRADHLDQVIEFITVFADQCHHGKEEDLLFPAMEEAGIPTEGGPIGVMLAEHNTGRRYVGAMSQGIRDLGEGNTGAISVVVENARNYIELLSQHIDKEDNILYPMAEVRLSARKQAQLLEAFDRVEKEKIGAGKHEQFHELVHRLEAKYLS